MVATVVLDRGIQAVAVQDARGKPLPGAAHRDPGPMPRTKAGISRPDKKQVTPYRVGNGSENSNEWMISGR